MNHFFRRLVPSALLCAAFAIAVGIATPAAAWNPFVKQAAEPLPNHETHNQIPDADPTVASITWEELMNLEIRVETPAPLQSVFHVSFPESVRKRDGTRVSIEGFMYPIEAGETHTYFLLSALPPSCPFCLPTGPRGLIEVKSEKGVRYTLEPMVVEGHFELLENDPSGFHYRLSRARAVAG